MLDLNAVALGTSPAYTLKTEHPSGPEYARYLRAIASHWQLPVHTGVNVQNVTALPDNAGFRVQTDRAVFFSRCVIWAAGEFQYPHLTPFPGASFGVHTACIRAWRDVQGDEIVVIGGYESGMDAAYHLSAYGKRVTVIDAAPTWESTSGDPSLSLSPYTHERLRAALATGLVELRFNTFVQRIERNGTGYVVISENGEPIQSPAPPLLATGFAGSLPLIAKLFEADERGNARLTAQDESTITPGLFVSGPMVRHPGAIFCFIYKFRQRFAVIAEAIGERLGLDTAPLDVYRRNTMFLEDLSCCDEECTC
jgi:thioredoxin reductase